MVYAVSDIHGQYDRFVKLLEKINFSEQDTLYILGDIIDRGPEIVKVVDLVVNTPNMVMLLGNHEDMLLNYWTSQSYSDKSLWYRNGGAYTDSEFSQLSKEQIEKYIKYFEKLPIEIEVEVNNQKFLLVHGNYVTDKEKNYFNPYEYHFQVIWDRVSVIDTGPEDKIVVFGHTPTYKYKGDEEPFTFWRNGNMIGIDCGMAAIPVYNEKCQLGCLCLDDMTEIYV